MFGVFLSFFRSSESDSKLERNIGFIAEVLVRHIFNLTTKVSFVLNLVDINNNYYNCFMEFALQYYNDCVSEVFTIA